GSASGAPVAVVRNSAWICGWLSAAGCTPAMSNVPASSRRRSRVSTRVTQTRIPRPWGEWRDFFQMRPHARLQRRALGADVEVDNAVIVDVDFAVVVEIPVEPAADVHRGVEIDPAVVVDVDLAIERGVAGVGELDQDGAGVDGFAAEE